MPNFTLKQSDRLVKDLLILVSAFGEHLGLEPESIEVEAKVTSLDPSVEPLLHKVNLSDCFARAKRLNDAVKLEDNLILFPLAKQLNNTPPTAA